jgi:uncharacterized protein
MRKMLNLLYAILFLYLIMCLGLYMGQRSLIYHPVRAQSNQFPRLTLQSDGTTVSYSVKKTNADRAVIYFGGNAEDTSLTMAELSDLFLNEAVYAMHYRGFADSSGRPSESALHADAQALYDKVASQHSQVIIIGRSLGSGVATQLASRNIASHLILVTPFDSLAKVAAGKFPFMPVNWLIHDRFDSWKIAAKIEAPVLVLAAAQDELIPLESTKRLVENFKKGVCRFEIVDPANHNSLDLPVGLVRQFVSEK